MKLLFTTITRLFLACLFLMIVTVSIIYAQTPYSQWNAECERRNILNGCSCDCSLKTDSIIPTFKMAEICVTRENGSKNCQEQLFVLEDGNHVTYPYASDEDLTSRRFDLLDVVRSQVDFSRGIVIVQDGQIQIGATITRIVLLVFMLLGLLALILGLIGGINIATAQGDEEKVKTGSAYLTNAAIGFAIGLAGVIIVFIVQVAGNFLPQDTIDQVVGSDKSPSNPRCLNELRCQLFGGGAECNADSVCN